jgi:uncharacterized protein YjiS (DUF1127 family)
MSAPIGKSQFTFELPNLSYVDASLEEPNLRELQQPRHSLGEFLARLAARITDWRQEQVARNELSMMTEHELADIGLSRGDLARVFDGEHNRDLAQRGCAA